MTEAIYFPPLAQGARVITDVVPSGQVAGTAGASLRTEYDGPCDVVLVAVPAGEGCAVEAAIRRALRVEGTA